MNDNPKISASKTFGQNQNFDLNEILTHAKSRTEAIDENGCFTTSIRIIAEIDDSEFLPKNKNSPKKLPTAIVSTEEEEDNESLVVTGETNSNIQLEDDEEPELVNTEITEEQIKDIPNIVYVLDEEQQTMDENQFVDNDKSDDDFGVITPKITKIPKKKKK